MVPMTEQESKQTTPPIRPLDMMKEAARQTWQNLQVIILLAAFFALFDIALGIPVLDQTIDDQIASRDAVLNGTFDDQTADNSSSEDTTSDSTEAADDDYFGAYRPYMIIANIIVSPILLMLLARLAMVGPNYLFSGGWADGFRRYTHVFWVQILVVMWLLLILFFISTLLGVLGLPTIISVAIMSVAALHVLLFGGLSISYAAKDRVLPVSKAFKALKSHVFQLFPLAVFPGLVLAVATLFVYLTGQTLLVNSEGNIIIYALNALALGIVNSLGLFFWYAIMRQLSHHFANDIEQQIDGDPRKTPWDNSTIT